MALVAVAVFASMHALPHAHARSADGFGRMERLLTSLRGSAESPAALGEASAAHPLEKRQIYDRSCKGVYDRSLFSKLEHVCDDCYNLYRTSYVSSACRSDCFDNGMFDHCVTELVPHTAGEYLLIRDSLRG
uniref:Hyperglycemic hormone PO preproprotein n=1 Tax=Tuerkayana celeste TaxID=3018950 RepID=G3GCC9_9EUCA|nr:hyperglycemic hormone PO preproprotein [Tuerkayana celeste]